MNFPALNNCRPALAGGLPHSCAADWFWMAWQPTLFQRRRVSSTPGLRFERCLDFRCDQSKGGCQRGVYIQVGRVEQVGVRGATHGRDGAIGVSVVARLEFLYQPHEIPLYAEIFEI